MKNKGDVSMTREAQASPSALAAVRQTIIEGYIQQDRSELCHCVKRITEALYSPKHMFKLQLMVRVIKWTLL